MFDGKFDHVREFLTRIMANTNLEHDIEGIHTLKNLSTWMTYQLDLHSLKIYIRKLLGSIIQLIPKYIQVMFRLTFEVVDENIQFYAYFTPLQAIQLEIGLHKCVK